MVTPNLQLQSVKTGAFHGSSHLHGGGAPIRGGGHCPAVRVRCVALRGGATGGAHGHAMGLLYDGNLLLTGLGKI